MTDFSAERIIDYPYVRVDRGLCNRASRCGGLAANAGFGQLFEIQNFFKPLRRVGNKFEDIEFYPGPETGCPIIQTLSDDDP